MDSSAYQNQSSILDVDEFDYLKIAIVGVGSIGSFLALALNKLGFRNIIVIDDDTIEAHNIPTQFYFQSDINELKVDAINNYLEGEVTTFPERVITGHRINADVVFMCVDSLEQRKIVANAVLDNYQKQGKPQLIIDGRMHRLIFRVLTIPLNDMSFLKAYIEGLDGDEFVGDCTEKGIIQNVFAVVAVMVEQFKKVINGETYSPSISCDFESYEFIKSGRKRGELE